MSNAHSLGGRNDTDNLTFLNGEKNPPSRNIITNTCSHGGKGSLGSIDCPVNMNHVFAVMVLMEHQIRPDTITFSKKFLYKCCWGKKMWSPHLAYVMHLCDQYGQFKKSKIKMLAVMSTGQCCCNFFSIHNFKSACIRELTGLLSTSANGCLYIMFWAVCQAFKRKLLSHDTLLYCCITRQLPNTHWPLEALLYLQVQDKKVCQHPSTPLPDVCNVR